MRAAVARVIGNRHGEAVSPVEVRIGRIAPQARRRIDARRPVRRIGTHGEHGPVAQPLRIRRRQRVRDDGVFVAAAARAPRHYRWVVHCRDGDHHGIDVTHAITVSARYRQRVTPIEVQSTLIGQRRQGRIDLRLAAAQGQSPAPVRPRTNRCATTQAHGQRPIADCELYHAQVAVHIIHADSTERQRHILCNRLRPRYRIHRGIVLSCHREEDGGEIRLERPVGHPVGETVRPNIVGIRGVGEATIGVQVERAVRGTTDKNGRDRIAIDLHIGR